MEINNIWRLKNLILRGKIKYNVGDIVILFRRKSNGYPKQIKDNTYYIIKHIEGESILIRENIKNENNTYANRDIKVNKTFMIPKNEFRDFKINKILKDIYN